MSDDKDDQEQQVYDRAQVAFQRLNAKAGDVILIKVPGDMHPAQMAAFADQLKPALPEGVSVLVALATVTIETLPKKEMNELGWYNFNDGAIQEAEH